MADLSQNLKEILRNFFTSQEDFGEFLKGVEKQRLANALTEVLDLYARDRNSSTLRGFITVAVAGYKWRAREKLGFNGWRDEQGTRLWAEAKPKNIERSKGDKFNGNGNFSDFTPERLELYRQQNLNMLVSCFVDGQLALIVEFPFNCPQFLSRIQRELDRRFPTGERPPGQYLRSLQFTWRHYSQCPIRLVSLNRAIIEQEVSLFTRDFRKWILSMADRTEGQGHG